MVAITFFQVDVHIWLTTPSPYLHLSTFAWPPSPLIWEHPLWMAPKVYIVWAKKVQALKIDRKCEGKLTCAFKNDMRNLENFHQSTWKSQNLDFDGILLSKVKNVWSLNLQGSHILWQWRMRQNLTRNWLASPKFDMRNLTSFDPSTQKSKKFAL